MLAVAVLFVSCTSTLAMFTCLRVSDHVVIIQLSVSRVHSIGLVVRMRVCGVHVCMCCMCVVPGLVV